MSRISGGRERCRVDDREEIHVRSLLHLDAPFSSMKAAIRPILDDRAGVTSPPAGRAASFYAAGVLTESDRDAVSLETTGPGAKALLAGGAVSPETGSDPRDVGIGLDLPPDRWFASVGP